MTIIMLVCHYDIGKTSTGELNQLATHAILFSSIPCDVHKITGLTLPTGQKKKKHAMFPDPGGSNMQLQAHFPQPPWHLHSILILR